MGTITIVLLNRLYNNKSRASQVQWSPNFEEAEGLEYVCDCGHSRYAGEIADGPRGEAFCMMAHTIRISLGTFVGRSLPAGRCYSYFR